MDRKCSIAASLAAGILCCCSWLGAQEVDSSPEPSTGKLNAITPTLGGKQFWADELFFHDWHIQRNVFTGHYRLLDGYNLRHAWGTFDECRTKLELIKRDRKLPPMQGPAVLVLHGLFRTPTSMNSLCRYLREEGGYTVFNVSYPTTRGTVADHARSLASIVENLEGIDELNFVGHSLGNLVVRHYLADQTRPEVGITPDARIGRIVMLGPPNQGAEIAEALGTVGLFHSLAGASATQLSNWQQLESHLATPTCEFGIVAGGRGADRGFNPWLTGDNDLVVGVEATRLPGATDFAVLPVLHSFMMNDAAVQQYTLRFLKYGFFISADARRPIGATRTRRWPASPSDRAKPLVVQAVNRSPGRIAGIDYGTKRVGIAISDPDQSIASPLENYTRQGEPQDRRRFERLAAEEQVVRFVVGLPVHLDGRESQKSAEAREFGAWLAEVTGVEVAYFDERFTTHEAELYLAGAQLSKKKRKARLDKLAAQIMLTAYLEQLRADPSRAAEPPRGLDD